MEWEVVQASQTSIFEDGQRRGAVETERAHPRDRKEKNESDVAKAEGCFSASGESKPSWD